MISDEQILRRAEAMMGKLLFDSVLTLDYFLESEKALAVLVQSSNMRLPG